MRIFGTIVFLTSLLFGSKALAVAAYDLQLMQRDPTNTINLQRVLPLASGNAVVGFNVSTSLPQYFLLGATLSYSSGFLNVSMIPATSVTGLSTVGRTGDYNDLLNLPVIPSPSPGPQGPAGPTGATGATGSTGPKGDQGDIGLTGAVGAKGDKGDQGDIGLTGSVGATGSKGDQGTQGVKGDTGDLGPQGSIGLTGVAGSTGATGAKGDTGSQGPKGDTGSTGPAGTTDYNLLSNKPTIPAAQIQSDWSQTNTSSLDYIKNKPAARSQSAVTRSIGSTGFQVSTTRDSEVHYSIEISTTLSLTGGQTGTVFLEISSDNSTWVEAGRFTNGNTGSLTIGLNLTQIQGGQLSAYVPTSYYVRLRSSSVTGSPTFSYRSGQEMLF